MRKNVLFVLYALALCLGTVGAEAENQACSCTAAACGNGAVGGDQGDIFTSVPPADVSTYFTPNSNTGWTCVDPAEIRGSGGPLGCFCANLCGNGGIGGDPNFFDLGLSQQTVNNDYGGGQPNNPTGWLCGNYRGEWQSPSDLACVCTGSACGNNAVGGNQGDIFTDLSATTVQERFETNPNTGWTCFEPAEVRGHGGPLGCYCAQYCGNGGVGANPDFIDLGLNQNDVTSLYGGGQPGNRTGWLCGSYRGSI